MGLIKATDIVKTKSMRLIYAQPGTGKTSTARYLKGTTLVVDIDKTTGVLKGAENVDIISVDTHNAWDSFGEAIQYCKTTPHDNIFIDNVSELERALLAEMGRKGKNNLVPSMADYQRMQFYIMGAIRSLKNIDKDIFITAWETTDQFQTEGGQIYNRFLPQISAKIVDNVMGLCDVVAKLAINTEKKTRGFILEPSPGVFVKNQLDDRKGCLVEDLVQYDD
ncbi:AAA family ATPase [Brochothrix campestris]|uniref:Phage protein n=1 Tax=Brochothrix campestris FSL F6-1037 TaxID=1265861 RepID=W7C3Z7_9LIST|nr:AAA family ATPase [Brochothrix campestris]EUJ34164.1 phage protein [Brochothrix campestris FSL F6-1037]